MTELFANLSLYSIQKITQNLHLSLNNIARCMNVGCLKVGEYSKFDFFIAYKYTLQVIGVKKIIN